MRVTEPTSVTQGEQIEWKRTFCDYPATEWTLEYRYRGPDTGFNITATADGSAFDAVLTSAMSAAADPGDWKWQAWATNIADTAIKLMLDAGDIKVFQGFASANTAEIDLRTDAKKTLDAIDAALLAFANSDIQEYEITTPAGNRHVKRSDKSQLTAQRKYWAGIVSRENLAERVKNGGPFAKSVKARMFER